MLEFLEKTITAKNEPENFEESACRGRILASLERTGFKEKIDEELIKRLVLLEQGSESNQDARQIERGVTKVLNYLEEHYADDQPELILTPEQKINARVAATLHDVGKSGPAEAGEAGQKAVIKIFALERVNGIERSIREVVADSFPKKAEAEKLLSDLSACSIDPDMAMKNFWDQHAYWTHDILKQYHKNLNDQVQIIASSHHINSGIDPYNRGEKPVSPDTLKTQGDQIDDLSVKVLLVMDKYQARLRRSGEKHEAAIAWVRNDLAKYEKDDSLKLIIDAVDELGKQAKIFA